MPISNPAGQFGNSQFVVDPTLGVGSFTTVQAGATAAALVPGSTLFIRPGTYSESVVWPAGIAVEGATTGNSLVTIIGNQIFSINGDIAFKNLQFQAAGGTVFQTINSGNLEFTECRLQGVIGKSFVASFGGPAQTGVTFNNCTLDANDIGVDLINTDFAFNESAILSATTNGLSLGISTNGSCVDSFFSSATTDAVLIASATASLDSNQSSYQAVGRDILFTANGSVTSVFDKFNGNDGSGFYVAATGAFGLFTYASSVLVGSAENIDPQVTSTVYPQKGAGTATTIIWQSIVANQTLEVSHGYFVTAGTLSLLLPATSVVGDEIIISLKGGTSFAITQAAGQSVQLGSSTTSVGAGGSLTTTSSGDSLTLRCSTANLEWISVANNGNFTVV